MLRTISKGLVLALLAGAVTTSSALAQNELRDKARAIQKEAAALAKRGETQAAKRLEREARERLGAADQRDSQAERQAPRPETERAVEQLEERLQDLLQKQKKLTEANTPERELVGREIARTEHELNAVRERLGGGRPPRPEFEARARMIEEAARRLQHIHVAAENLKAAGIHDLAIKLTEQAEMMERELGEAKRQLAREMDRPGGSDPRDAEILELSKQNERLQAEIRALRRSLEKQ
jgi:hypothetical protein